jgi:hypothetical protein
MQSSPSSRGSEAQRIAPVYESSQANAGSARTLFVAGLQQTNHLGNAGGSLGRAAFRGIDPGEVPAPVELGKRIEERPSRRLGVEGHGDVRRQVGPLWPLGRQDYGDFITGLTPQPRRHAAPRKMAPPAPKGSTMARTGIPSIVPAT